MRHEVIQVDSNEQTPILFPETLVYTNSQGKRELIQLTVEKIRLNAADYRMKFNPTASGIERKKGLAELATNLMTDDRVRFGDAWNRFITTYRHPILLIETPLHAAETFRFQHRKVTLSDVMARVNRLILLEPRLIVIWNAVTRSPSSRKRLGTQLVRLMLDAAQHA